MKINLLENEKIINKDVKEYYNTLRTNIQLLGSDNKILGLTSIGENEGKSTVSVNLAISLASVGLKVILVDTDTRKSVMAGRFKIKRKINGLTNYLSGGNPIEDIIFETDVENLHIIPAGAVPPNPTALLQNQNFDIMLKVFRDYYDYVILDTPPIGMVVDAAIVAQKCDGMILLVESGKNKRKAVERAKEQIEKSGKFVGIVINKYDVKTESYGSYVGYGGYGGYGNYGKTKEKGRRK